MAPGNESGLQPSVIYSGSVPGPMGRAGMTARLWRSLFALGANWVVFMVHDSDLRLWETPISEARSGAPSFVLDFRPGPPVQYILSRFGPDSELRRWGLKLAASGGKRGKKRAIVAVARKLAVVLLSMWRNRKKFEPFPQSADRLNAAA